MSNIFRILSFLIFAKSRSYLSKSLKSTNIVLNLIILVIVCSNTAGLYFLLKESYASENQESIQSTLNTIYYILIITPIFILFFPSFKGAILIFKRSDPINPFLQTIITFIYEFISPVYIILFLATFTFFILTNFSFINLAFSFLLLFISNIIVSTIQKLTTYSWKIIIAALLITAIYLFGLQQTNTRPFSMIGIFIFIITLSIIHLMMLYETPKEQSNSSSNYSVPYNSLHLLVKVFVKTSTVLPNIVLAVMFKTGMLLLYISKPPFDDEPHMGLAKYMFISPLIYFTYIHNNLWGYLSTTYKNICAPHNIRLLFQAYMIIISFNLIFDMVLTISTLVYSNQYTISTIIHSAIYYLATSFILSYIGFYASLSEPMIIKKAFHLGFKPNTSLLFGLLSMCITIFTGYLFLDPARMYFLPIPILFTTYLIYNQVFCGKISNNIRNVFHVI